MKLSKYIFSVMAILALALPQYQPARAATTDSTATATTDTTATATAAAGQTTDTGRSGISFPIPELGNCASKQDCKAYCDQTEHITACVDFAKAHGLIKQDDAQRAKKLVQKLLKGGPGGCKSFGDCKSFCDNTDNLKVCAKFAKDNDLAGDSEEAQKFTKLQSLSAVQFPGGCKSMDECKKYCADATHIDECLGFAQKAGFISEAQAHNIKQLQEQNKHNAEKAQQQSQQDQQDGQGIVGPGGCTSQDACEAFCNDPQNQQTCLDFAKTAGIMSNSDIKDLKEKMKAVKSETEKNHGMPEDVKKCIELRLGNDVADQIDKGTFAPSPDAAQQVGNCMRQRHSKGKEEDPASALGKQPKEGMQPRPATEGPGMVGQWPNGGQPEQDQPDQTDHADQQPQPSQQAPLGQ